MEEPIIPPPPRETIIRHKRERNLQILLPIIAFSTLTVLACALVVYGTVQGGDVATWAAIATICLAVPIMITSLIVLAILSGMIYGSAYIYKETPTYSGKTIDAIETASVHIKHYSDAVTGPIISLKTWLGVPERMSNKKQE